MDPTNTPSTPPPDQSTAPDLYLARTMKDLGLLLKDGEIQAAPKEQPGDAVHDESTPYPMVTLGEAAGRQAEEAKANTGETADQSDAPPAAKEAEKPIVVQKPDVESLVKAT